MAEPRGRQHDATRAEKRNSFTARRATTSHPWRGMHGGDPSRRQRDDAVQVTRRPTPIRQRPCGPGSHRTGDVRSPAAMRPRGDALTGAHAPMRPCGEAAMRRCSHRRPCGDAVTGDDAVIGDDARAPLRRDLAPPYTASTCSPTSTRSQAAPCQLRRVSHVPAQHDREHAPTRDAAFALHPAPTPANRQVPDVAARR